MTEGVVSNGRVFNVATFEIDRLSYNGNGIELAREFGLNTRESLPSRLDAFHNWIVTRKKPEI